MKKTLKLKRQTLRLLTPQRIALICGARNGLSEVVGGCTRQTDYFCEPGPADDTNG